MAGAHVADQMENGFTPTFTRNLWRRIVSGIILVSIASGLLIAGSKPFAILVMLIAIMMSWEWGRMVRAKRSDPAFVVHAASVAAAAVLTALNEPIAALGALAIGAVLVFLVRRPKQGTYTSVLGVAYVGFPTIALIWFRADPTYGFQAALYLLVIVWAADTAAFIGGKYFGGFKLWPSISPNKTWAGFISATIASALVGAIVALAIAPQAITYIIFISLLLGAISQLGDLAESAMKRGFGVKDASDLIPGHGGFMDRMDGVVAVAVAAALMALVVNPGAPAQALFFGQ